MQTVLITGANGLVGKSLARHLLEKGYKVLATGRGVSRMELDHPHLSYFSADITHPFELGQLIAREKPDCIVHCAAMTQVDDCERHRNEAHVHNVEATARLLLDVEAFGGFFIFLSTDFVFDGEKGMYTETDMPRPVNWYGHTKMEAEAIIESSALPWAIVRTCLVYGQQEKGGRHNIGSWIKENLQGGKRIQVVDDQWRTPTWAPDLADGIEKIIRLKTTGIWHISGEERFTPFQMATQMAAYFNWDDSLIERVTEASFSQPGKRPLHTGFSIEKAKKELGFCPGTFKENIRSFRI